MRLSHQQGFTLIEILVSLAVGILLLAAASSVGLASLSSSKDSIINSNAQQQLQIVMNSLTRELRRAGYSKTEETSKTATGFRNIKFLDANTEVDANGDGNSSNDNDCVIFLYDKNASPSPLVPPGDGATTIDEIRGIRVNTNQIELLTSATFTTMSATTPDECDPTDADTDTDTGTWEALSNSGLNVTGLTLTPTTVMLIDGSYVVDQVNVLISANSNSTPPHPLNLSEVIQLRNRPYSNN